MALQYEEIKKLSFGIYYSDEIIKLSSVEITNPRSFDENNEPLSNGLYDFRFGPNDDKEVCLTCNLEGKYCPGHSGHINLPKPVLNPAFISTIDQLIQWSCFKCSFLQILPHVRWLLIFQLQVLDYGLIDVAENLSLIFADYLYNVEEKSKLKIKKGKVSAGKISQMKIDQLNNLKNILENEVKESLKGLDLNECKQFSRIKSVIEYRQKLVKNLEKSLQKNVGNEDCLNCHSKLLKVRLCDKTYFSSTSQKRKSMGDKNLDTTISNYISSNEIKEHLHSLWQKEHHVLRYLFKVLDQKDLSKAIDIFFIDVLMVPSSKFRPFTIIEGRKCLHAQSRGLKIILQDISLIKDLERKLNGEIISSKIKINKIPGKSDDEKLIHLLKQLQNHVNGLYDGDLCKNEKFVGIKQILEKKKGILREHMMGKRVNFAARTVISPDPYINVDEVGVPVMFAKKLTYPELLTQKNIPNLMDAIINGPYKYPGATCIERNEAVINLREKSRTQRRHIMIGILGNFITKRCTYKIHRHLQNEDIVLLNRQPTLHKPSTMAHKVKLVPSGKTLRLNYSVCKSYNADFDGDEINLHLPQNEIARVEAHDLVNVKHQYLGPRDGNPLIGLIQDHVVAGTLLTMRGVFFDRSSYQQLVYGALEFFNKPIKLLRPAMIKPNILWSGKQIISTILLNIFPKEKPLLVLEGKAHVDVQNWITSSPRIWNFGGTPLLGDNMSESEVVIRSGELLCGVLDKNHIGPTSYGLLHCCYEFYGADVEITLLTSLSRLFINYLQYYKGFTIGIEDILLSDDACKERRELYKNISSKNSRKCQILDSGLKTNPNVIINKLKSICMPSGLLKNFPKNNLQLMIQSGAKGSNVNAMQISCALGQVELEGCTVPLTVNGKTLPSFTSLDNSLCANGFVNRNFLIGLNSQEFFFHCLAGREGFVNAALKTSDSGYLERSVIKHLEGVTVNYDLTVRDSDGTVIQFLYGDDGLDLSKIQMLKEQSLHILHKNCDMKSMEREMRHMISQQEMVSGENLFYRNKINSIVKSLTNSANRKSKSFTDKGQVAFCKMNRPDLQLGVVSEKLDFIIWDYIKKSSSQSVNESNQWNKILDMFYYKAMKAIAHPGEPVGILAAQSVGEPSTQMTLNTFHSAGQSEMDVTLGMPRLLDILMNNCKTLCDPIMELSLLNKLNVVNEAKKLCLKLSPVLFSQVLQSITVSKTLCVQSQSQRFHRYTIKFNLLPEFVYEKSLYTTASKIMKYIEDIFMLHVINIVEKKFQDSDSKMLFKSQHEITFQDDVQNITFQTKTNSPNNEFIFDEELTNVQAKSEIEVYKDASKLDSDSEHQDITDEYDNEENKNSYLTYTISDDSEEDIDGFDFSPEKIRSAFETKQAIIHNVCDKHHWITHYNSDLKDTLWCAFILEVPLGHCDIKSIIVNEVNSAVIHSVLNIKRAVFKDAFEEKQQLIKTDGVNFSEIFKYDGVIDMKKIYTNDINAFANTFGIEAARALIIKEIQNIFIKYKITIDVRHLSLIADYMTRDGTYQSFNRKAFQSNASPLQQMSFETPVAFLETALVTGAYDNVESPSSKLAVGQLVNGGTSVFDLFNVRTF